VQFVTTPLYGALATWPVSLYWMAVGLITFVTTLSCRETAPVRTGLR